MPKTLGDKLQLLALLAPRKLKVIEALVSLMLGRVECLLVLTSSDFGQPVLHAVSWLV